MKAAAALAENPPYDGETIRAFLDARMKTTGLSPKEETDLRDEIHAFISGWPDYMQIFLIAGAGELLFGPRNFLPLRRSGHEKRVVARFNPETGLSMVSTDYGETLAALAHEEGHRFDQHGGSRNAPLSSLPEWIQAMKDEYEHHLQNITPTHLAHKDFSQPYPGYRTLIDHLSHYNDPEDHPGEALAEAVCHHAMLGQEKKNAAGGSKPLHRVLPFAGPVFSNVIEPRAKTRAHSLLEAQRRLEDRLGKALSRLACEQRIHLSTAGTQKCVTKALVTLDLADRRLLDDILASPSLIAHPHLNHFSLLVRKWLAPYFVHFSFDNSHPHVVLRPDLRQLGPTRALTRLVDIHRAAACCNRMQSIMREATRTFAIPEEAFTRRLLTPMMDSQRYRRPDFSEGLSRLLISLSGESDRFLAVHNLIHAAELAGRPAVDGLVSALKLHQPCFAPDFDRMVRNAPVAHAAIANFSANRAWREQFHTRLGENKACSPVFILETLMNMAFEKAHSAHSVLEAPHPIAPRPAPGVQKQPFPA